MAETFGQMLHLERERMGLSIRQFAPLVNLTPAYVCFLENGKRQPSVAAAVRIAKAVGLEPLDVLAAAYPEILGE